MNTLLVLSFRVHIILILIYVMRLSLLFVKSVVLSLDLHLLVGIARNRVSGVSLLFREIWVVIESEFVWISSLRINIACVIRYWKWNCWIDEESMCIAAI